MSKSIYVGGKYIDKVIIGWFTFAMKVANHNYPDIIQHGDAFQIREWEV